MQLAAFLCVICAICGRIICKCTQTICTNETTKKCCFGLKIQNNENTQEICVEDIKNLSEENKTKEWSIINKKGEVRFTEAHATAIVWNNNKALLTIFHDLTDIRRVVHLTAEINEKSRVEKLKDEFISIVSHEMRTPLTIIKGAVSNLKDGIVGDLNEKQIKVLDTTNRNIDRLARIINDLLDLSRLESGKTKIHRRKLELTALIDEIISNFSNAASERNIQIESEIPHGLPAVFADGDMIVQVLTNLIQNALRYAKSKITIRGYKENLRPDIAGKADKNYQEMIKIGVIDDGTGIAKNDLALLFNKFEQINRPEGGSGYKGTGLGLAICKQIITLNHGKIWANSDTGKGAEFYFLLPVYHESDDLLVALEAVLQQAEKSQSFVSILSIAVGNLTEILAQSTERDIAWMFNDLSREIRNKALRKSDFMHFRRDTREFVVILLDADRNLANQVASRIHNLTKDCFCPGKNGKVYASLKTGVSIYPDDSQDAHNLLEMALKEKQ